MNDRGRGVGEPGRGARDVDDPAALGGEVCQALSRERHGAVDVAVHEVQEDVVDCLVDRSVAFHPADASVVDEDVNGCSAQALEGLLDNKGSELGICDFRPDRDGLGDAEAAALVEGGLGCFTVARVRDRDLVQSLACKLDCDGSAYAS